MKKRVKMLLAAIMSLCLIISPYWDTGVVYAKSSKAIKRTMHSGTGRKRRTLQRARVDSRKDLKKGLSLIEDYIKTQGKSGSDVPIDGTPTNQKELYSYLRGMYYNEDCFLIIGGDEFKKFEYPDEWGYDGQFVNWQPLEVFMPGISIISYEIFKMLNVDNIQVGEVPFTVFMMEYDEDDIAVIQRCKEIATAIKNQYGIYGDLECAKQLKDYLLSISKYNKRNYEMYQLLFEGQGNCQAYTDAFDTIMKFMDIPCTTVESMDYNHAWDIFYADGKVYKVDVTNNWGPDLLEDTSSKIYEMDYPEVESKILDIERNIILADRIDLKKVEFEVNDISDNPLEGLPTMQPIQVVSVTTGSAITVTPTPIPTPTPTPSLTLPTQTPTLTPTPTVEPVPTDTVNLGITNAPGQVTIADEDEANTIFAHKRTPTKIDISRLDIGSKEITVYCTPSEYGGTYHVFYRRADQDWVASSNKTGIHNLLGLKPDTTYYIKVRNVIKDYDGTVLVGEWSKVYKVTTDD